MTKLQKRLWRHRAAHRKFGQLYLLIPGVLAEIRLLESLSEDRA